MHRDGELSRGCWKRTWDGLGKQVPDTDGSVFEFLPRKGPPGGLPFSWEPVKTWKQQLRPESG